MADRLSLTSPISSPLLLFLLLLPFCSSSLASAPNLPSAVAPPPFPTGLEALQKRLGYSFKAVGLLRRAVTHPSFSQENYRALAILGFDAVRSAIALRRLGADPDISSGDLSRRLAADTSGEACAADGLRLGLQGVVRVAAGTNASGPSVLCGALRAVLGAVALDAGDVGACGDVFRRVHGRRGGGISDW